MNKDPTHYFSWESWYEDQEPESEEDIRTNRVEELKREKLEDYFSEMLGAKDE